MKRALSLLLTLVLFAAFPVFGEEATDTGYDRSNTYAMYMRRLGSRATPANTEIIVDGAGADMISDEVYVLNGYAGRDGVVDFASGVGTARFRFSVEREGLYAYELSYFPVQGASGMIELALMLDGAYPYNEARSFVFPRMWEDAGEKQTDNRGNELSPSQTEKPMWITRDFADADGVTSGALALYLTPGEHYIDIISTGERFVLDKIRLYTDTAAPDYSTYRQSVADTPAPSGYIQIIQAEAASYKSDSSIAPLTDRSSPATQPYHPSEIRINVLGGESWQYVGQTVTWNFTIPENGLYCISARYLQRYVRGFFTSRNIYIDGACLFDEMRNVRFSYNGGFAMKTLGDAAPFEVYLTAGEHTISMEATLGDMAEIFAGVDEAVYQLNAIYRKIVMITGASPDPYVDYVLENQIPDLIASLRQSKTQLEEVRARITATIGDSAGTDAMLVRLIDQTEAFSVKPYSIPDSLKNFRDNISSLAAWLYEVRYQPLQLDYIAIHAADAQLPEVNASFAASLAHEARAFGASFTNDYNSVGNVYDADSDAATITVWIGSGRDQAQILKKLVDDIFTPRTGIQVNIALVQGTLVQAILTGIGPDVALGVGRGEPVNLAMRGALYPLDEFDGFDEVITVFSQTAMTPYEFQNEHYALPETQDFHMMFYRTDIFEELGINPPNTWEELYKVLPTIQRNNMGVGLPYRTLTAYDLVYTGMGSQSIFPSLLLQSGGSFYSEDMTRTALDTPEAIGAFKEWTEFYTNYGLDVFYDFGTRFRSGEMPLGIASYTTYNYLTVAAPEIRNLWKMRPIPGTAREDGSIDRTEAASGSACIMIGTTDAPEESWAFMKWWTSAEIQARYGRELETVMGAAARYNTANQQAFLDIGWTRAEEEIILEQWAYIQELPEIPGGYYMSRSLDNAFREVETQKTNPRETLYRHMIQVDAEITRKRMEFGLDVAKEESGDD